MVDNLESTTNPNREHEKKRYEPPKIIFLGELAKGSGVCQTGTDANGETECRVGTFPGQDQCNSGPGETA